METRSGLKLQTPIYAVDCSGRKNRSLYYYRHKCSSCGFPFKGSREAKYCSRHCRDRMRCHLGLGHRGEMLEGYKSFQCDFCGKEFDLKEFDF